MTRSERLLLAFVVASVLFAPLFFGGVGRVDSTWSGKTPTTLERFLGALGPYHALAALAVATAAAAFLVAREREAAGEPSPVRLHPALLLPVGGLALLALVQLLPLPRALLGLLSPPAASHLESLLPGDRSWRPLSVSPGGTRAALGGLGIGAAALVGALLLSRRAAAARVLLGAVVLAAVGSALYGLHEQFLGEDTVLGFPKRHGVGVTGFFVNRSHMAAAAGMALPVALALAGAALGGRGRGERGWIPAAGALLAAAAVLAVTIPLTNSRMGLAAGAVGVAALGLLATRAARWPAWARGVLVIVALALVAAGTRFALDRVPELKKRFDLGRAEKGFFDVRFPAWKSSVELAARYPVFGTGLGTFETAIHETQSPNNPDELVHAHSEPLEALAEGGVLGLALAVAIAFAALGGCLRLASAEDPWTRAVACGCGGALAALLAGCTTEFHMHIPALGIAAAVLAAIPAGLAAGTPRTATAGGLKPAPTTTAATATAGGAIPAPTTDTTTATAGGLKPAPTTTAAMATAGGVNPASATTTAMALAVSAAMILAVVGILESSREARLRSVAIRAERGGDADGWLVAARRAVAASPGDAFAHRSLSGALLAGPWDAPGFAGRAEEALREADRSADQEPFDAWSHWSRVKALLATGRKDEVVAAVARARSRAGGIGHLHFAAGRVLFLLSRGDPALEAPAFDAFRAAGECEPRFFTDAWMFLEESGVPLHRCTAIVPERRFAIDTWCHLMRSQGRHGEAYEAVVRLWRMDPTKENADAVLEYGRTADREEEARRLLGRGPPAGE